MGKGVLALAPTVAGAWVGLLILVSACSDGTPERRPGAEVIDSASTRIITYPQLDGPPASLVVDSVPRFRVGWDPAGRLFERIEGAAVLLDGRTAVVDGGGTQDIVILDQNGTVLEVLGGLGEGPGEFTRISRVVAHGGRLIVQDFRTARATIYDGTELDGTYRLPFLDHKSILGTTGDSFVFGPPLMMVQGRLYPEPWRRVAITVSSPPFSAEDTLIVVDWDQSLEFSGRDPWAASGMAAFDGEHVIYGRGDRPELIWYGLDGRATQIVRWESPRDPVSDSAYAEFEEDLLEQSAGRLPPATTRGFMEQVAAQHQGVVPYIDQIFVDADGTVWLGEFLRPEQRTEGFERTYYLFSRDGEALGTVALPAELRVLDITTDLIVGYELGPFNEPAAVGYDMTSFALREARPGRSAGLP